MNAKYIYGYATLASKTNLIQLQKSKKVSKFKILYWKKVIIISYDVIF